MRSIAELPKSVLLWLNVPSRRGVSAIEYGLLAALIALAIIAAVTTAGTKLKGVFTSVSSQVHS
ncbi:MAG: Flp family type IVb pilin [Rhodomicrobium sp.]